ncbi:methylated-DNA--[protein]-cysteine S-methyltransferase [Neptunitalea lumnitzerae]|uniref:Methylated-DNA--protein-cysteine methyltransferase n=1 Tax=Neptunitalea lumnitzerae TaxID=2965509 RepID=A0ABQ5MH23_9FLAO|nr:methylated-DNA--[protein]-cysteine S-methyltransferase [Neptunitalea sp. Y10]GLB48222.1 methylated-DNA--protein-cysteine methyltransferase [Neptunitalea sp. Y10]
MNNLEHALMKTPLGVTEISGNANGIQQIKVLDAEVPISTTIPESLQLCVTELTEYFKGNLQEFTCKLNPTGTDFQKKVWNALVQIPYGKTMSYAALSTQLGDIKAIRAVAAANGKNPLWIIVPCHRVIGSDGSLTGYAGGLWRKKWLLELENPVKQQSLF